ncbi:lasso peptide biosynthesis B2 protein [Bacillus sp. MRMR6]|uniref:lasso peptide biosynthesis B2 protein n=1 Tax=Bacillus sp. MRMR6 TaxID=1928617 RepID=UPI000952DF0B|nr:lasso peptide biosynthesis B2 protein [Bacillus sp. MRMR6]OLS38423.1 stage V sporulation protein S [Bacillus sp. MRMR6]
MTTALRKLKIYLSLGSNRKKQLLEAFILLGWARLLKLMPFKKIAPSLGNHMEETSFELNDHTKETLRNISWAIHTMSRYTVWESQCLVRAIAGMKMLKRRNIESTLYLGTGKDETGKMIAHAWLRSGSYYVSGAEGMEKFTVVGKFANKVPQAKFPSENR